MRTRPGRCA